MLDLSMASRENREFCINCQKVFDRKSRHLVRKLTIYEQKIEKLNQKIAKQKEKLSRFRKINKEVVFQKFPESDPYKVVKSETQKIYGIQQYNLKERKYENLNNPTLNSNTFTSPLISEFTKNFGKVTYKEVKIIRICIN